MDQFLVAESLKSLDEAALFSLLKKYNQAVVRAESGTCRHRNAVVARENIRRELTLLRHRRRAGPAFR